MICTPYTCPHKGVRRFFCLLVHELRRSLGPLAIGAAAIFLLALVIQRAYYQFMPGTWFLDVTSASVPTTRIGEPMVFTFCRNVRTGNVHADAVRTFFKVIDSNHNQTDLNYQFSADIEPRNGCQNILLKPGRYPNKEGTYFMYTTIGFKVHGVYKEVAYQTPPFLLSGAHQSTQQQIDELMHEIMDLKKQQDMELNYGGN